jgi:hypothetical protein
MTVRGSVAVVLLEAGAAVDALNDEGSKPLHSAAWPLQTRWQPLHNFDETSGRADSLAGPPRFGVWDLPIPECT